MTRFALTSLIVLIGCHETHPSPMNPDAGGGKQAGGAGAGAKASETGGRASGGSSAGRGGAGATMAMVNAGAQAGSAGSYEDRCNALQQAFASFIEAHRSCASDADCAVVGDCGPNADFTAVQLSAADEARDLQRARCPTAYDGPVFLPVCTDGRCALLERHDTCCGCPGDFDAGC